ncbi:MULTISPECIES: hypothetical protein [unclassified Paenibacillus]|uniref:hypothetical protein n=1 Tax=unclassified Paenibacillus TaxID=185978 RepID=UPI002404D212|nr:MULTISPECIES: hypothetical protein [unclassified Paenibacillus]MDF9845072.1 hypothetical protein [Paenibacillus sp. PastF-2]MDF9851697.1 hypothetical protein [Paenibacillus sp. PastM-2]MDF9858281.1 hypothetical protein [Paenibacillus sp. PastF-1]MDH6483545.1 hypothetical protein [Paenibacillus sp. PastH-2]MDH6510931.1 hypothetical protein [Paenibacillus sp. PastM-3]
MSISAGIDIYLSEHSSANLTVMGLIRQFTKEGWDYVDRNGEVTFLPLGDGDCFNWQSEAMDSAHILNIIEMKQTLREIVGIQLLRRDLEIGCDMLMFNTNQIGFSLSIARKSIEIQGDIDMTDFSWYLERILPVFKNAGLQVERVQCEQTG